MSSSPGSKKKNYGIPGLQETPQADSGGRMKRPKTQGTLFDPDCPEHAAHVRQALSVSGTHHAMQLYGVEQAPLGREPQFRQLRDTLLACCEHGSRGRSVYISGLPGTGKSFTVQQVLRSLECRQRQPPICAVLINCMALADASVAGVCSAYHQALRKDGGGSASRKKKKETVVLVLDEVDRLLLERGPDEITRLFMMPVEEFEHNNNSNSNMTLIAISNALDLTERMLPALKCRGVSPEFIPFPAYGKTQVHSILSAALQHLPWPVFEESVIELVARSVSTGSGDLRQAFKVCETALDTLIETKADQTQTQTPRRRLVGLRDALPAVQAQGRGAGAVDIRSLPNQQQLALLAAAVTTTAAGAPRVPVRAVYGRYSGLCKELFVQRAPPSEFNHALGLLSEQALVDLVIGRSGVAQVSLRVLADGVLTALQAVPFFRRLGDLSGRWSGS